MIVGIGCDIVDINRIRADEQRLADRILTEREQAEYNRKGKAKTTYLAGRFAAKEALIKAGQTGRIRDYEILNDADGAPHITLPGHRVWISIAHEKETAIAMVVLERERDHENQ